MLPALVIVLFSAAVASAVSVDVNASLMPTTYSEGNYTVFVGGDVSVYTGCNAAVLRARGYVVFLVEAVLVNTTPEESVFLDSPQAAYEASLAAAEQLAWDLRSMRTVTAYLTVMGDEVLSPASIEVYDILYGTGNVYYYTSSTAPSLGYMVPMTCKVVDSHPLDITGLLGLTLETGDPYPAAAVAAELDCTSLLPPGSYAGTATLVLSPFILWFDRVVAADLSYIAPGLIVPMILVDTYSETIWVYIPLLIGETPTGELEPVEPAKYQGNTVTGIVTVWMDVSGLPAQPCQALGAPAPVTQNIYFLAPSLPVEPGPGTSLVTGQPSTCTLVSSGPTTCYRITVYDAATGEVVEEGPGARVVLPQPVVPPTNLTGQLEPITPPNLVPSGLPQPSLSDPAGIVATALLASIWIALISIHGLATGSLVAGFATAFYGFLAGNGYLVTIGIIGAAGAVIYRYVAGSA